MSGALRTSAKVRPIRSLIPGARRTRIDSVSQHPVAKEDVALVVDEDLAAESVRSALRDGGGELLESVRLFDVYSGPQVPDGKKSLAFSLRMRADDRTLTEDDIAAVRDGALAAAGELGATLRA